MRLHFISMFVVTIFTVMIDLSLAHGGQSRIKRDGLDFGGILDSVGGQIIDAIGKSGIENKFNAKVGEKYSKYLMINMRKLIQFLQTGVEEISQTFNARLKDIFNFSPNQRKKRNLGTIFNENKMIEHLSSHSNVRTKRQADLDGMQSSFPGGFGNTFDKIKSAISLGAETAKTVIQNFKKMDMKTD